MLPCFSCTNDNSGSSDFEEGNCIAQSDVSVDTNELEVAGNLVVTTFASRDWQHNGKNKIDSKA